MTRDSFSYTLLCIVITFIFWTEDGGFSYFFLVFQLILVLWFHIVPLFLLQMIIYFWHWTLRGSLSSLDFFLTYFLFRRNEINFISWVSLSFHQLIWSLNLFLFLENIVYLYFIVLWRNFICIFSFVVFSFDITFLLLLTTAFRRVLWIWWLIKHWFIVELGKLSELCWTSSLSIYNLLLQIIHYFNSSFFNVLPLSSKLIDILDINLWLRR